MLTNLLQMVRGIFSSFVFFRNKKTKQKQTSQILFESQDENERQPIVRLFSSDLFSGIY